LLLFSWNCRIQITAKSTVNTLKFHHKFLKFQPTQIFK
jgi:hypothetical protein